MQVAAACSAEHGDATRPKIQGTKFGSVTVDGETYDHDIVGSRSQQQGKNMDDQTDKNRDTPNLDSIEAGLLGVLLGFYQKTMNLLRESNLDDEKLELVSAKIKLLIEGVTTEIRGSKDLDVQGRLESAYEEVKRLVDELSLSSNQDGGESA